MPEKEHDEALEAFKMTTTALLGLPDKDRERVLRASAILIGVDFMEDERLRRASR